MDLIQLLEIAWKTSGTLYSVTMISKLIKENAEPQKRHTKKRKVKAKTKTA